MNDLLIYVDDELIDLYPNTVIQVTYSNLDIGDLTSRNTSYTNTINLPYTENNVRILSPLSVNSASAKPYLKKTVKVVESGHQIFVGTGFTKFRGKSISFGMAENDVDIFELLQTKLVSEAHFGSSGQFNDAGFYAIRNSVSDVAAPVVNWGKLNNYPIQELENGTFTGGMDPWINISNNTSIDWVYSANAVSVTLPTSSDASRLKSGDFTFYAGYKYRITINLTASSTAQVNLFLSIKNVIYVLPIITTSGAHSFDVDINLSSEVFGGFEIYGGRNAVGGSNTITIQDVTIVSDYDSFIEISDPFYLPMFNYKMALRFGLEQFDDINDTGGINLDNFTQAQSDYIDSLLIAYTRGDVVYSDSYLDVRKAIANADGTQSITVSSTPIQFAEIVKNGRGVWSLSNSLYTVGNSSGGFYGDFTLTLVINITSLTGGATIKARLEEVGGTQYDSEVFTTTGIKHITIDTKLLSDTGYLIDTSAEGYRALIINNAGIGSFNVSVLRASIELNGVPVVQDESVMYSGILLPDISAFDLLKDFVVRTGSLTRYDKVNEIIETKPIENILSDTVNAKDWTDKRVPDTTDSIEFSVTGYAETNYFQDTNETENTLGRMSVDILNENIEREKIYYESEMDTILDEPVKTLSIANLKAFVKDSNKSYSDSRLTGRPYTLNTEGTFALIKTRDNTSEDPVVKYGSTTAATFKVGNYAPWTDFKELFYGNLENALYNAKVVTHVYNLNQNDIKSLDLWRLIYDSGAYYLILEVRYTPGKLSTVKLMKTNTRMGSVAVSFRTLTGICVYTGFEPTLEVETNLVFSPLLGEVLYTGIEPTLYIGPPI